MSSHAPTAAPPRAGRPHAPAAPPAADQAGASRWQRADSGALLALGLVLAMVALNRLQIDAWISRFDLYTFFVPWYHYLGAELRELQVPGWNPYLFSGTPFAADPESGWLYLPAMLAFAAFDVITGFKALLVIHLAAAGFGAYWLGRVLGFGPLAALGGALIFSLGPVLQWTSYCCLVLIEYAVWVPLALVGVELAIRAANWRGRLLPWFISGFALSQMLAGWVGQGWLVGPLVIGSYAAYRLLLAPLSPAPAWRDRLALLVATGVGAIGSGVAMGAAGIWPRLVYNAESNLAGGIYSQLGGAANDKPAWTLSQLAHQLLGEDYGQRFSAVGGAVVVLALLAPFLAGRRYLVPYFALLTLVSLILTQPWTPVHALFYLIPRFEELHIHDPWRVYAMGIIGPAMLGGAALATLPGWRGRRDRLPLVALPLLLMSLAAVAVRESNGFIGWTPLLAAAATTLVLALYVAAPTAGEMGTALTRWAPVALLGLIVLQPAAVELTGAWFGWPRNESWEEQWRPDPNRMAKLRDEIAPADPGGPGAFLQAELAAGEPFRYLGYGGAGHADRGPSSTNYMGRRLNDNIHAILVNGRAMFLGLHDTQGYNPLELGRYADLMTAINGKQQDYHLAYLLPDGIGSPLLDLLNLRYIVVDRALPADRDDRRAIAARGAEVYRDDWVIIYERAGNPRPAWIVHDVRTVAPGEALPLLAAGTLDLTTTALVEGEAPPVAPPPAGATETATITEYTADRITLTTASAAPGLLVLSEMYADGWQATIAGEAVAILPTNHALRGIPLPAGEHTVVLEYAPRSLQLGLVISGVAFAGFAGLLVGAGWRRFGARRAGSDAESGSLLRGRTPRALD